MPLKLGVLYFLCVLALTSAWCPTRSFASNPKSDKSDMAADALKHLAELFQNSQTLTYTFRYDFHSPDRTITIVRGFAEKPNKFRVQEFVDGKLDATVLSDGQDVYAFSPVSAHVQKMAALKSYSNISDKAVQKQTTDLLGNAFVPVLMFLSGNPDMAPLLNGKQKTTQTASTALLNGLSVVRLSEQITVKTTYSTFIAGFQDDINAETGLIQKIQRGYFASPRGSFNPLVSLEFSQFVLSSERLPASLFQWSPPFGVILDAPVLAQPVPSP